jgi:hypothetical protein
MQQRSQHLLATLMGQERRGAWVVERVSSR